MGRAFDAISDSMRTFIASQSVFFVATAPLAGGRVNLSPKGYDTFRVLGPECVAYLDLTGSGAETIAHVRENGRITFMFCAFEGKPMIVRLYGEGRVVTPVRPEFASLRSRFGDHAGVRAVIVVDIDRTSTSCGYAVPEMDLIGERPRLAEWADAKSDDELRTYRSEKNRFSIDGLPAID